MSYLGDQFWGETVSYQGLWLLKQLNLCRRKPFGLKVCFRIITSIMFVPALLGSLLSAKVITGQPKRYNVHVIPTRISSAAVSTLPATARSQGRWVKMLCPVSTPASIALNQKSQWRLQWWIIHSSLLTGWSYQPSSSANNCWRIKPQ